jgi:hypothetical protein
MTICFCYRGGDREAAEVALRIQNGMGIAKRIKKEENIFIFFL